MEDKRSYCKILWKHNMPVFHVVNRASQEYLFFTDPILSIYEHIGKHSLVKRMNNEKEGKGGYHLGEIKGCLTETKVKKKEYYNLKLYFGTAYQKLVKDPETNEYINLIDEQEYIFPKEEFDGFIVALKAMHEQQGTFQKLLRHSFIRSAKDDFVII